MISKLKRNTVLTYCMASLIMLLGFMFNVTQGETHSKTNSKKVVAENNYVETDEISYGLVALEASSLMESNKETEKVTEKEKKEEDKKSTVTSTNKESSAQKETTKKTTTKKTTTKSSSKKTTTKKTTTKNTTTKKTTSGTKTAVKKTSTTTTKVPSNKELGTQIANYAKQFVGNPYKRGGTSLTNGADCSGFTQSVYKHFGISLPRSSSAQAGVGVKVSFNSLEPGDLVFYKSGKSKIGHVAIYIGNGKIVHSQTPKDGIGIDGVNVMTKVTARRVVK